MANKIPEVGDIWLAEAEGSIWLIEEVLYNSVTMRSIKRTINTKKHITIPLYPLKHFKSSCWKLISNSTKIGRILFGNH